MRELVDDAVAAGATLRCGGPSRRRRPRRRSFYAPTVLTGVTHEMRIMREEIFGPVLPIVVVDSEEEAIDARQRLRVRPRRVGLDRGPPARASGSRGELESGMVWINDHMFSHGACQCAWGGVKESGLGRTHSKFGLYECVNVKLRVWEPGPCATPGGTPTTRRWRGAARLGEAALRRPSIRAKALREGAGPLLRLGGRTLRKRRS